MQWACDHFYWIILLLAAGHLLLFARLWKARQLQSIWLADHLENLVQGLSSRADRDPYLTVDERIDSFLANVREVLDEMDLFDRVQLAQVVQVCRDSRSMSEAGRHLFGASRTRKKSANDADRLRKYLSRFGIDWRQIAGFD